MRQIWKLQRTQQEVNNMRILIIEDEKRLAATVADLLRKAIGVDIASMDFPARSTITPVWNDADDPETALERIITQKWIAIFPLGNEAWAEYRRTGYPRLAPTPDECNKSGGTVTPKYGARRLQYPTEEYAENRANVEAAAATISGGDNAGSRVWWDKKPLN